MIVEYVMQQGDFCVTCCGEFASWDVFAKFAQREGWRGWLVRNARLAYTASERQS